MNAQQLVAQVLERVRTFDFGAKDGPGDHDPVSDRLPAGDLKRRRVGIGRQRDPGPSGSVSRGDEQSNIRFDISSPGLDAIQTKAYPPKGGDAKSPV